MLHSLPLIVLFVSVLFMSASSKTFENTMYDPGPLSCYVCNYFESGYDDRCDVGEDVWEGCHYCMHTYTVNWINYNRNTYTKLELESKVCGFDEHTIFARTKGCIFQYSNSGWVRRCICFADLCNANKARSSTCLSWIALLLNQLLLTAILHPSTFSRQ